ncbi:hypothetical protein OIU74_026001 [Salix koriyanagi]|uniref:Uncharacterized protein n=1 Tax=Salix koriyanagi TaxID=2511006 RepID=A0A9Q0W5J6_9ROSI|nr:hypothetical protein OIU74_026001 [Salix koriyanagi]
MSGDQALELKCLESIYEEVLDENCKVFAKYFKELVTNGDDNRIMTTPPSVILKELGGKLISLMRVMKLARWKNSALKMDGTM